MSIKLNLLALAAVMVCLPMSFLVHADDAAGEIPPEVRAKLTFEDGKLLIRDADDTAMEALRHFPEAEEVEIFSTMAGHLTPVYCEQTGEVLTMKIVPVLTEKGLMELATLKHLKTLKIGSRCKLDVDTNLACLKELKSLTSLELGGMRWNGDAPAGDDVKHLVEVKQLESLTLHCTMITDENLELLKQLPRLESLRIMGEIGESVNLLGILKDCKSLKRLYAVDYMRMADGQEKYLAEMPQLEVLELWSIGSDGDRLAFVRKMPALEELNIVFAGIRDEDLAHLANCPKLRSLNVSFGEVTAEGLAHLAKCQELRTLYLSEIMVDDDGLAQLGRLTKLESLCLMSENITDAGMAHLKDLKNLKTLSFWGGNIGDAGMAVLENFTQLEYLFIVGDFTDAGLANLRKSKHLKTLHPFSCHITPQGLAQLKDLPELTYLSISLGEDVADLSPLGELKHLQTLYLSWPVNEDRTPKETSLTDADFAFLAELPELRSVHISSINSLTDAFLGHLENLEHLESVRTSNKKGFSQAAVDEFRQKRPKCYVNGPPSMAIRMVEN